MPDVYTMLSNRTQTYTYDSLNRNNKIVLSTEKPVTLNYIYWLSDRNTDSSEKYRTTKIKNEFIGNTVYRYNYDKLGNIIQIEQGTRVDDTNTGKNFSTKLNYVYDALSQLTRENNAYLNQTITYTYDQGGNITSKKIYPYTTGSLNAVAPTQTIVYNYGNSSWTDLLTSYNGKNITYDAIGNPTAYLGYTLKWNGRQLSSLSGNGVTASYKYDADGLRSYKKVNGVETTYQYVGDKLMYEKRGTTEFYYYYNSFGNLAGIRYVLDGTQYVAYVICNSRGDVEDLYWASGNLACHYTYDSWGNVISITDANGKEITNANHIGLLNPIRYRGYYYDSETGMYYLHSRYYDPQICRCINADTSDVLTASPTELTDKNLFAYCDNNPVVREDKDGQFWNFVIGATVGALVGGVSAAISSYKSTGSISWGSVAIGAASGAIGGLVGASGIGMVGQAAISGVTSALSNVGNSLIRGEKINWTDVAIDATIGAGTSLIGSVLTSKASNAATNTVKKGIDKIVTGKTNYDNGSRYWKGAVKKGFRIMREGLYQLNVARGKSSVIGSISGGVLSIGKALLV